jgi:hypothetical protein
MSYMVTRYTTVHNREKILKIERKEIEQEQKEDEKW